MAVHVLLDLGAHPSQEDSTGKAALHYATWTKDNEILWMQLEKGADTAR